MSALVNITCATCKNEFQRYRCHLKRAGRGLFCSRDCKAKQPRPTPVFDSKDCIVRAFEMGYRVTEEGVVMAPSGNPAKVYSKPGSYFHISVPTCRKPIAVHRLAAYQKFGNVALEAECVRHLNDKKQDNRLLNISYGSRSDNQMDIPDEKRKLMGRRRNKNNRQLSDEQVKQMRLLILDGWSIDRLVKVFNCSIGTVVNIKNGRCYVDVADEG